MKKRIVVSLLIVVMLAALCSCMVAPPAEINIPDWARGSWKYAGKDALVVEKSNVYHYNNNYLNKTLYDRFNESSYTEGSAKIYEVTTYFKGEEMINIKFKMQDTDRMDMTVKSTGVLYTYNFTR